MKSESLVLLSGEPGSLPEAEARALFLAYDPASRFTSPEPRVLLAESEADPFAVGARVAFARRVGIVLREPSDAAELVNGKRIRLREFALAPGLPSDAGELLRGVDATVDLGSPDFEFTLVRGRRTYLVLTSPLAMRQRWSHRRPRQRPFFHPSAIFPKLSRALVNLSGFRAGEVFLDPFSGTGSLPIEAAEVGARVLALDLSSKMAKGALANMKKFGQSWLGAVRCDSFRAPLTGVDAIATDLPYGRASSTRGLSAGVVVERALESLSPLLEPGRRMVLMHASHTPVPPSPEFAPQEEHNLYVHKRLTRTITVLRRK